MAAVKSFALLRTQTLLKTCTRALSMKAVRLTKPGDVSELKLHDTPVPEPLPHQVRVRVSACGVCHRDVLDRKGAFPFIQNGIIPGHEIAGVIDQVGSDVQQHKPGQRVVSLHWSPCGHCEACVEGRSSYCFNRRSSFLGLTNDGGYAQYVVCGASAFVGVPQGFTAIEAATVMCTFGTVWHAAITRGRLQAGERILITGATGGVGSAAVQMAKAMGCHITAITSSESKIDFLKELGVDETIVTQDTNFHRDPRLKEGVQMAFEAVGAPTFLGSLRALRPTGRLVLVGNVTTTNGALPLGLAIINGLEVIGSDSCTAPELARCFRFLQQTGIRPKISKVLPLEQFAEAQTLIETRAVSGRIVLKIAENDW